MLILFFAVATLWLAVSGWNFCKHHGRLASGVDFLERFYANGALPSKLFKQLIEGVLPPIRALVWWGMGVVVASTVWVAALLLLILTPQSS